MVTDPSSESIEPHPRGVEPTNCRSSRDPAGSAWRSVKRLYRLVLVPIATSDRAGLRWLFFGALLVLYALALPRAIEGLFARDAHG